MRPPFLGARRPVPEGTATYVSSYVLLRMTSNKLRTEYLLLATGVQQKTKGWKEIHIVLRETHNGTGIDPVDLHTVYSAYGLDDRTNCKSS
jgi:hypothetical protein